MITARASATLCFSPPYSAAPDAAASEPYTRHARSAARAVGSEPRGPQSESDFSRQPSCAEER